MDQLQASSTITSRHSNVASLNYMKISVIKKQIAVGRKTNIVALVVKRQPPTQCRTRSGISQWMRKLIVTDETDCTIELAIWGGEVTDRDIPLYSVIAARDVMVRDFQREKTLSCLWAQIQINPEVPQAAELFDLAACYLATSEVENTSLSEVSNSFECPRSSSLVGNLTPTKETAVKPAEGRKMDEVTNTLQCSRVSSGMLSPITTKRANSYLDDNSDEAKRRKTEQSVYSSTTNSKPSSTVTSPESMETAFPRLNFETSSTIKERVAVGKRIDIIGFVVKLQSPIQILTKSGTSKWMRKVFFADDKSCEIELAIWGGDVSNRDIPLHSVIMARNVMVQGFQGDKTLNCLWAQIEINPDVPQAALMRQCASNYLSTGKAQNSVAGLMGDSNSSVHHRDLPDNFTPIGNIKMDSAPVNIIGLVIKCTEATQRQIRTGNQSWIRVVTVTDNKGDNIPLTVWCGDVEERYIPLYSVIIARDAQVYSFRGATTLSCWWKHLQIDPDVQKAAELRKRIPGFPDGTLRSSDSSSFFTPFSKVKRTMKPNSQCNIAGLVIGCEPVKMRRTEGISRMQILSVADGKDSEIEFTVLGSLSSGIPLHSVIAARHVEVRQVRGNKILTCPLSNVQINPSIEQAEELRKLIAHYQTTDETPHSVDAKLPEDADESRRRNESPFVSNFTSIEEIKKTRVGSEHNIAGLVVKIDQPEKRKTKAGNQTWIRVMTVADAKDSEIDVTIWGNQVTVHDIPMHSVITTNVIVRKFDSETTLSCFWPRLRIDPDIPESTALKKLIPRYSATSGNAKSVVTGSSENEVRCIHQSDLSSFINFSTVSKIKKESTAGSTHDVVGRVINRGFTEMRDKRNNGKRLRLSVLTITDDKDCEIEIMMWGEESQKIHFPLQSMITAKDFVVCGFNEKKMLSGSLKNVTVHLNIPRPERREKLFTDHSTIHKLYDIPIADPSTAVTDAPYSRRKNRYQTIVFTPIKEIKRNRTEGAGCNVIGIVSAREPTEKRKSADGKDLIVRNVRVADEQKYEISLSVWGSELLENDIPLHSVIIAKNVTLQKDDSAENVRCLWSDLEINPNILRAALLRQRMVDYEFNEEIKRALPREFDPISNIKLNLKVNTKWDVIGCVGEARAPKLVALDTGEDLWLTAVKLRDDAGNWIGLLIWCDTFPKYRRIALNSVLAVQDATLVKFEGKHQLCTLWNWVAINPDIPAARSLKEHETILMISSGSECATHNDVINDLVPIDVIRRLNTPTDHINTFGLIVEMNPPEEHETLLGHKFVVRKYVLRGRNRAEIELHVKWDMSIPYDIPLYSMVVASKATLELNNKKNLVLVCSCIDVRYNVVIPETRGFQDAILDAPEVLAAQRHNNFTGITKIRDEIRPGVAINIVGRVVNVVQPTRGRIVSKSRFAKYIVQVTLRDANSQLIDLIIKQNRKLDDEIKMNSVIAAKDAIVKLLGNDIVLWCWRMNVTIEPAVPERYQLRKLTCIPFVRPFTPLTDIKRKSWLEGCPIDIIGQVVEVHVISNKSRSCYTDFVLKNEIEMILRVYARKRSWTDTKLKNAIIVAKNALLTTRRETYLLAYALNVYINPKIPEVLREAMSFGTVSIQRILESAKAGDVMGVLAVIVDSPNFVSENGWKMHDEIGSSWKEYGDEDTEFEIRELEGKCVKLIDSSGKTILMKIWPPLTNAVKKTSDRPVVLRAINVEVRDYRGELRLACTQKGSCVVNPKTEEAGELLNWYIGFCKSKDTNENKQEFQVIPIKHVLEDLADNAVTSIMGILIKSEVRQTENVRLLSRRIQVIGGENKIINIVMHDTAAMNFTAPLHSVIMVKNFRVARLTSSDIKIGVCDRHTEFIVNPSDDKYRIVTETLVRWFALNSTNINAGAVPTMENNPVIPAAGGTADVNDIVMAESPQKMEEDTLSLREESASAENERTLDELNSPHRESSPDLFADC